MVEICSVFLLMPWSNLGTVWSNSGTDLFQTFSFCCDLMWVWWDVGRGFNWVILARLEETVNLGVGVLKSDKFHNFEGNIGKIV